MRATQGVALAYLADPLAKERCEMLTLLRWWLSLQAFRVMYRLVPDGDAKSDLGRHIREWTDECERQHDLRKARS